MKINSIFTSIFLGAALVVLGTSTYTVLQTESAIVVRLGKLITVDGKQPRVIAPGLQFKFPILDIVKKFDTRIRNLDIKSSRILTIEKKDVLVDYYVNWRIDNLAVFYTRTGGKIAKAESLISKKVAGELRAVFGMKTIKEVVSDERAKLMQHLKKKTNEEAASLGVSIIDVRIKQIDLPREVSSAVYKRMRSERDRVAKEYLATGEAIAMDVRADADLKARIIVANAKEAAQKIKGAGEAKAAKIYTEAYKSSPQFFDLSRSFEAYLKSFKDSKKNILVIQPNSKFFKHFKAHNANR